MFEFDRWKEALAGAASTAVVAMMRYLRAGSILKAEVDNLCSMVKAMDGQLQVDRMNTTKALRGITKELRQLRSSVKEDFYQQGLVIARLDERVKHFEDRDH